MSRFCTGCGTPVPDGELFCGVCGTSVNGNPAPAQAPVSVSPLMRDSKKTMWLVAIVAQLLCLLLFLLPTIRITLSVPESLTDLIGGGGIFYISGGGYGGDRDGAGGSTDIAKGNFKYLNVVNMFTSDAFNTILLAAVIVALVLMIRPVIKKTEYNPIYAFYMLLAQGAFFVFNIIMFFIVKGKPVSMIKKFAKMICIDGVEIPKEEINSICDMVKECYKFGFSIWGWLYLAVSVAAIGILAKIVYDNKDKIFDKFKKDSVEI